MSAVLRVRVLLLLGAIAGPSALTAQDLLLLRDGSSRPGRLQACVEDVCQFDGSPVQRSAISCLGLGVPPDAVRPAPRNPNVDEVHLVDGTIEPGPLLGISLGEVRTETASFPRPEVRWVCLAPQAPPPAPPGRPAPPPARPDGPVKPCPADKPLGGWIRLETTSIESADSLYKGCTYKIHSHLRFGLLPAAVPSLMPWPAELWPGYQPDDLVYEIRSEGCIDNPGDDKVCHAPGGERRGTVTMGRMGESFYDKKNSEGYFHFYPVEPGLAFEVLPEEISQAFSTPLHCEYPGGSSDGDLGFGFFLSSIGAGRSCGTPPVGYCTAGTPCTGEISEEKLLDCMARPDHYAVIPFAGSLSWSGSPDYDGFIGITRSEVSWQVCCGCGAPRPMS